MRKPDIDKAIAEALQRTYKDLMAYSIHKPQCRLIYDGRGSCSCGLNQSLRLAEQSAYPKHKDK